MFNNVMSNDQISGNVDLKIEVADSRPAVAANDKYTYAIELSGYVGMSPKAVYDVLARLGLSLSDLTQSRQVLSFNVIDFYYTYFSRYIIEPNSVIMKLIILLRCYEEGGNRYVRNAFDRYLYMGSYDAYLSFGGCASFVFWGCDNRENRR